MARLKIREGSCEVWHVGKSSDKTTDTKHKKGDRVRIDFVDYSTSYTFKGGKLVKADAEVLAVH